MTLEAIETEDIKPMRLSLKLFLYKPWLLILGGLSDFFYFFAPIVTSLLIREIFNTLQGAPSIPGLNIWVLVGIIPLTAFFRILGDYVFLYTARMFNWQLQVLVRKNTLEQILDAPGAESLPESTGDAISRFRGDIHTITWFPYYLFMRLVTTIYLFISLVIMYRINRSVTLYAIIPFAIAIVVILSVRKAITKYNRANRKAAGKVTGAIGEIFHSIQAIKVVNAEQDILNNLKRLNETRRQAAVKDSVIMEVMHAFYHTVIVLGIGVVLILVSGSMGEGVFSPGDLAFFITVLNSVGNYIWNLANVIPQIIRTKIAFGRLYRLIKHNKEEVSPHNLVEHGKIYLNKPKPQIEGLIKTKSDILNTLEVRNLGYKYNNNANTSINNINFKIKANTVTVLAGKIGSGKSTVLKSVIGLLDQQEGELLWNKKLIENPKEFFTPPRVAYTPQVPYLFSTTIKENISQGYPVEEKDIEQAIRYAVFETDTKKLKDGLDTLLGTKGVNLSGGQRSRVAAARMYVKQPELLVFDDLSSALDVETEQKMWNRLFADKGDKTLLIVSHRASVLKQADQIILMNEGQVEDIGTLDELLDSSDNMQKLYSKELINGNIN